MMYQNTDLRSSVTLLETRRAMLPTWLSTFSSHQPTVCIPQILQHATSSAGPKLTKLGQNWCMSLRRMAPISPSFMNSLSIFMKASHLAGAPYYSQCCSFTQLMSQTGGNGLPVKKKYHPCMFHAPYIILLVWVSWLHTLPPMFDQSIDLQLQHFCALLIKQWGSMKTFFLFTIVLILFIFAVTENRCQWHAREYWQNFTAKSNLFEWKTWKYQPKHSAVIDLFT